MKRLIVLYKVGNICLWLRAYIRWRFLIWPNRLQDSLIRLISVFKRPWLKKIIGRRIFLLLLNLLWGKIMYLMDSINDKLFITWISEIESVQFDPSLLKSVCRNIHKCFKYICVKCDSMVISSINIDKEE
jgi:hypothetical protein